MSRMPGKISGLLWRQLFSRTTTKNKSDVVKKGKGLIKPGHVFRHFDCNLCKSCTDSCPSGAISIVRDFSGGVLAETKYNCFIDYSRCIMCGQCISCCSRSCLSFTGYSPHAEFDKKKLIVKL